MKKEKEERKIEKEIKTKTCLGGEEEQQQQKLLLITLHHHHGTRIPSPCSPARPKRLQYYKVKRCILARYTNTCRVHVPRDYYKKKRLKRKIDDCEIS
jgi:hypothetical protein